ncbi:MAG: mechanosensitive ion channel family protein [Acidobacteriota bacterium]|nr:mechanosensitive ion channel [Acidobacteriota bacterium]
MKETVDTALYIEILLAFTYVVLSFLFFRILRLLSGQKPGAAKSAGSLFIGRSLLPLAFLLTALAFKLAPLSRLFSLSKRFQAALDAALLFFFFFLLIRLIDSGIQSWHIRKQGGFPIPRVLHGFILFVLYLAVVFGILRGYLGFNITPFLATSAILTMILGLAFQGVLSNIVSGMSFHFTKSLKQGDWIRAGEMEGLVIETNWRETRIFDLKSNIVIIPNDLIATKTLTNFSLPDKKTALTLSVKAGYDAPPFEVLNALKEAAADVPDVLDTPPPEAYVTTYDDLGIAYTLKFWISNFRRKNPITGEVGRLVWYKFKRRGITIPIPVGDTIGRVLSTLSPPERIPAERDLVKTADDLLRSEFLRDDKGEPIVPAEELRRFAAALKRHRYSAGETLFKQGDKGDFCYVIARGTIRGRMVYDEAGKTYPVEFTLGPGEIFGEMALFTDMPRTATGVVIEEAELLEIRAEDFARLLQRNPTLAETIASLISRRNSKNRDSLKKIKELSAKDIEEGCSRKSILARLKGLILSLTSIN